MTDDFKIIEVSKLEAARRQIETAIYLHFHSLDSVSIHTLASASFRILRDLARIHSTKSHREFAEVIIPGREKFLFRAIGKFANYFKHADFEDEPNSIDFNEKSNELILWSACLYFQDFIPMTQPMKVYSNWVTLRHPDLLLPTSPGHKFRNAFSRDFLQMSNEEQIEVGRAALESEKD